MGKKQENFSNKLDENGITDDDIVYIDIDGSINPIGRKTGIIYYNQILSFLNNEQAHGVGPYDIRYYILRNSNWTIEEKQKLVMDFWYDQEMYDNCLEEWEWSIINNYINYNNISSQLFEMDMLYEYDYATLLNIFKNEGIVDNIVNEINFCKLMHKLRPMSYESENNLKK